MTITIDYFDRECLEKLKDRAKINLPKYETETSYWLTEEVENLGYEVRQSDKKVGEVLFDMSDRENPSSTDLKNAIRLHQALDIDPELASSDLFWTVLSHHYPEYIRYRYNWDSLKSEEDKIDKIQKGFVYCGPMSKRTRREGILPRLWSIAEMTFDPAYEGHNYDLTEVMLSDQDLAASMIDRTVFMNKTTVRSFLKYYKRRSDDGNPMGRNERRSAMVFLDQLSDNRVLESLDEDDIVSNLEKHESWYRTKYSERGRGQKKSSRF